MAYVFDTNSLIVTSHYYPDRFPNFWDKFNDAVEVGKIIFVRETLREFEQYGGASHLTEWVEEHRDLFRIPSPPEAEFVREIFSVPHFQTLMNQKTRLEGHPCADPFIIALAKVINGCVVTEEKKKPKATKIPNVCEHFDIDCTNLQGFMEREKWRF